MTDLCVLKEFDYNNMSLDKIKIHIYFRQSLNTVYRILYYFQKVRNTY